MTPKLKDILIHLKAITGDSIIAWSVNHIIENEELNEATIALMVGQIKDQIHDNPEMMKKILSQDNYIFFDACNTFAKQ